MSVVDDWIKYCRVCGHEPAELPWGKDGALASFEICECCGVEFGYEDATRQSTVRYRELWIENFVSAERLADPVFQQQLTQIPEQFR